MPETCCKFSEGQLVRVKRGGLAGMTGRVGPPDGSERTTLWLDTLPATVCIVIDQDVLEPLTNHTPSVVG